MKEVTQLELESIDGGVDSFGVFVWAMASSVSTVVAIVAVTVAIVAPVEAPIAVGAVAIAANSWNNMLSAAK